MVPLCDETPDARLQASTQGGDVRPLIRVSALHCSAKGNAAMLAVKCSKLTYLLSGVDYPRCFQPSSEHIPWYHEPWRAVRWARIPRSGAS